MERACKQIRRLEEACFLGSGYRDAQHDRGASQSIGTDGRRLLARQRHVTCRIAPIISRMCAWSVTETLAEFSREMRIVEKAASKCNVPKRLVALQQGTPPKQVRGTVKPERMDEMAASRAPGTEKLLQVTHRDPCFRRDGGRREFRIGETGLDQAADACEHFLALMRCRLDPLRREEGCKEIEDDELHLRLR